MNRIRLRPALCSASVLVGALWAGAVQAAPQILAIAATTVDIPMQCDHRQCIVELSSICLQEFRASPMAGTEYYIANDKSLEITGVSSQGRRIRLPANIGIKITAMRGHNGVRVTLPRAAAQPFKATQLTVAVPPEIALVPVARKGDPNPQSELDIELASGPFRKLADKIAHRDDTRRAAAELVNLTINRLDVSGRSSIETREAALAGIQKLDTRTGFSPASRQQADKLVRQCFNETMVGYQSFRQCLGSAHDQLIGKINTKYWNHLKSGS